MQIIGPQSMDILRLMKRCQNGVGGRGALDAAHEIMAECYGTLGALMQARDALAEHVIADCACPCCGMVEACADDCTFSRDDAAAYDRMQAARAILFVPEDGM